MKKEDKLVAIVLLLIGIMCTALGIVLCLAFATTSILVMYKHIAAIIGITSGGIAETIMFTSLKGYSIRAVKKEIAK